jgi:hypothetical protein
MERIPFGNETKFEIIAAACLCCNTHHGHLHEFGCVLESCPACGSRLLQCKCKILGIKDALRTIRAVPDTISDRAEVKRAIKNGSKHLYETYYEEGVMLWFTKDVTARDPEMAKIADELLADMGFKKSGEGYLVSAESIAPHVNTSVDEAREVLEDLQAESVFPDRDQHTRSVQ